MLDQVEEAATTAANKRLAAVGGSEVAQRHPYTATPSSSRIIIIIASKLFQGFERECGTNDYHVDEIFLVSYLAVMHSNIYPHEIAFKRQLNAYCTKEAEQMISKQKLTPKSYFVCACDGIGRDSLWPMAMECASKHLTGHFGHSKCRASRTRIHTLWNLCIRYAVKCQNSLGFSVLLFVCLFGGVYILYIYIISLLLSVMHDRPAADQRQRALWHGCWAAPLVAINQLIILFYFSSVLPLLRAVVYIGVCSVCCFRSTYWNFKYFDFRLYYCFGCALLLFSDDRLSVPFMFLKWFEGKKNWSISTSHAQGNHYDINHPLFVLISNAMTMLGW